MKTNNTIQATDDILFTSFGDTLMPAGQSDAEIEALDAEVEAEVATLTAGTTCAIVTSLDDADQTILVVRVTCVATGAVTDFPLSADGASHADMKAILVGASTELNDMRVMIRRAFEIEAQCASIDAAKRG